MNNEEIKTAMVFIKDCVSKVGEKMPFSKETKELAEKLLDEMHKKILKEEIIGMFINVDLEKENEELKKQNKDLCESLDIMNNRESELLDQIKEMQEQNEKMKCGEKKRNYD